ncbi:MAG: serine--tRNA ligase [Candidatus Gracilibacteria bacterium]
MIDLKQLIENPEKVKKAILKKRYGGDLDAVIAMDTERRKLMNEVEGLKAQQNKSRRNSGSKDKTALLEESKTIKERIKKVEPKLEKLKVDLEAELLLIPNPTLDSVPEGTEEDNKPIKTVGKKPVFDFEPLDHMELGKKWDLIDMETAAEMSGTRFYYLKNELVLLEFALLQFVVQKLVSKGFAPILPPVLVKEKAMVATGFFPADRNEIYHVNPEDDNLYLVGTSEVPLCMLHADKIVDPAKLPLRYMGFSSCFRREAGSYSKDTYGIIRVHQFDKIEMFSFCHPSKSEAEHELILATEEEIMSELGFHYQVVNICAGDLGNPAAKKYDIEVWIPTQQKFRELTSCSNCTDYQARRANIRMKGEKGTEIIHTLNGTAIAMSRTLVAIMENYQQKDGTIAIPEVLQGYMGGRTHIGK